MDNTSFLSGPTITCNGPAQLNGLIGPDQLIKGNHPTSTGTGTGPDLNSVMATGTTALTYPLTSPPLCPQPCRQTLDDATIARTIWPRGATASVGSEPTLNQVDRGPGDEYCSKVYSEAPGNSLRALARRTLGLSFPGLVGGSNRALFIFSEENLIRKAAKTIIEWGYPFISFEFLIKL